MVPDNLTLQLRTYENGERLGCIAQLQSNISITSGFKPEVPAIFDLL